MSKPLASFAGSRPAVAKCDNQSQSSGLSGTAVFRRFTDENGLFQVPASF